MVTYIQLLERKTISMKKWKIAFFTSLVLLLGSNAFWFYIVVDQAISYSYLHDSNEYALESKGELGDLIVKGASKYDQKDILHLLRQADPQSFIVEEGDKIITSYGVFNFKDGKLVSVQ